MSTQEADPVIWVCPVNQIVEFCFVRAHKKHGLDGLRGLASSSRIELFVFRNLLGGLNEAAWGMEL